MSVARTAHLNMVDSSGSATNTKALDCAGGSTLVVFCENSVNTANDTTGATYNGVAMTEFMRTARPSTNRELVGYYLHNPASGSNNIVVSRNTASGRFVISAFAYSGTDTAQSYSEGDGNAEVATGTSATATVSFSNDGGEAVCGAGVFGSGGQAGSTDTTLVSTFDIISDFEATTIPGGASDSLVATCSSGGWCIGGIALKEESGTAYTKDLTEAVSLSDGISMDVSKTFASAITLVDTHNLSISRLATEVVTLVDGINTQVIFDQALTDAIALVDSAKRTVGKLVSEATTLADEVYNSISKLLTDAATLVDTATTVTVFDEVFSEVTTLADSMARSVGKNLTEAITGVDGVSYMKSLERLYSEAVTLVDTASTEVTFYKTITDAVALVDSIASILTATISLTENVSLVERFYGLLNGVSMFWRDTYSDKPGSWVDKYHDK